MLQQIGDPVGILHVCFSARHCFDVLCIGDNQLEETLQTPIDRQEVRLPYFPSPQHYTVLALTMSVMQRGPPSRC